MFSLSLLVSGGCWFVHVVYFHFFCPRKGGLFALGLEPFYYLLPTLSHIVSKYFFSQIVDGVLKGLTSFHASGQITDRSPLDDVDVSGKICMIHSYLA